MKTIEEIRVEKTFYKREKDILGNVIRTPYQSKVKREPIVVTPGVRFGYYLLDIIFYYIISFIIVYLTAFISLLINPNNYTLISFIREYETIISLFIFFTYYVSTEYFFGGTFGKLICGYVVINQYANKMSFGTSLLRTLCRYVPLEAFSAFGERAWHDTWSKTYVVKRNERNELKKFLKTIHDDKDILD